MSEKYTIAWIMADEPLLKLKEPDETYDIAEDVYKFIKDNKLDEREDFQVEVVINKEEDGENGNGIITLLKEVGGTTGSATEAPKEEVKEESAQTDNTSSPTPNEDLIVKELIVNGVSVVKKSVKFTVDKDNDIWYNLDESINVQEFKDKCTRKTLEVSIRPTDQGNDVIVGFTIKEEEKDTSKGEGEKDQEPRKSNGNMTQKSIEAQASINSANRVAQAMITPDSKPDDVKKIIRKVAEFNFELIQEFKNKD